MGIHAETHPTYQEGCDVCRYSTVGVAPSATPTRKGGAEAARINATEKEWAKDHRAYRAIRANGMQPPHVKGAAQLENASDKLEIEAGALFPTPEARKTVREQLRHAADFTAEAEGLL